MATYHQEFKEWEYLNFPIEITNLQFVDGVNDFDPHCIIKIWRDDEFKLKANIRGTSVIKDSSDTERSEKPGNFVIQETIKGNSFDGLSIYELHGCFIGSKRSSLKLEDGSVISFDADIIFDDLKKTFFFENQNHQNAIRYEWFLTSKTSLNFPRSTVREKNSVYVKCRTGFDDVLDNDGVKSRGSSRDFLQIETLDFKCFVAQVPSEFATEWAKCICIEYRLNFNIPDENIRTAISEIVSFVFGTHLLAIGSTVVDDSGVVEQTANSPWGDNVRAKCSKPSMPPVFLNDYDSWGIVERLINKLLPTYVENRNELQLRGALWNYWVAKELPIGVNLPILSSAVEAIINAFLTAHKDISSTYMPFHDFQKLIDDEIKSIEFKLHDISGKEKILNKIRYAFNRGANEKIEMFFETINLPINKIEKDALRARNTMAHGSIIDKTDEELKKLFRTTRAYETLFNRIILKILGYDEDYIDYYKEGHPSKLISVPTGS